MSSDCHEAGVYMLRHKRNGDTYVGATCFLTRRISAHLSRIRLRQDIDGHRCGRRPPFDGAFVGCTDDDIEVRILERVEVPACENPKQSPRQNPSSGIARLMAREQHWIDTLQPALNVRGNRKVDISKLPVGPPAK